MNFNFPNHCDFYKFLLVEELALCPNPALIHYGKCSIIGYLSKCNQISSLTIPNLEKNCQVPDCSFNVRLQMNDYPRELLNSTVEIFGEVRLFDLNDVLHSAHSLINKLRELQVSLEAAKGLPTRPPSGTNDKGLHSSVKCRLQKEIEDFKKRFKPIVQVDSIKHVQDARSIIAENLRFRQIQEARKTVVRTNS